MSIKQSIESAELWRLYQNADAATPLGSPDEKLVDDMLKDGDIDFLISLPERDGKRIDEMPYDDDVKQELRARYMRTRNKLVDIIARHES